MKNKEETQAAEDIAEVTPTPKEQPKESSGARDAGFRRRMLALMVLIAVILLIFLLRLAQFQLVDGADFLSQAQNAHIFVTILTNFLPLLS